MFKNATSDHLDESGSVDGQSWYDLYNWLLPLAEMWVRDSRVSSWYGQQKEISEDIAHETVIRTFRYHQRADRGELAPIGSLKALSRVIALNYFRDWRAPRILLILANAATIIGFQAVLGQLATDHLGPFPKRGADSRLKGYPIRGEKA